MLTQNIPSRHTGTSVRANETKHARTSIAGRRVQRRNRNINHVTVAAVAPTAVQVGVDQTLAIYIGALPVSSNASSAQYSLPVLPLPTASVQSAEVPEPSPQERKEIGALFDRWNAALQTGSPEAVAQLYAPDAILLPTVSNQVRACHESKVDYFAAFLQIQPYGTLEESYIRFLHPSKEIAANSGVYTFKVNRDGEQSSVSARYSFIYRKMGGQWKIIEHHSSAMPEVDSSDVVAALFDKWNAALQTGDAEQVAALYAPDAILLPTVSNEVRINHASRVNYFKSFLQLKPFGTIDSSHIRYLSPTIAANSGVYTFLINRDGIESTVTARFSFVYRKIGSNWMIIEHHSSAMPEAVTSTSEATVYQVPDVATNAVAVGAAAAAVDVDVAPLLVSDAETLPPSLAVDALVSGAMEAEVDVSTDEVKARATTAAAAEAVEEVDVTDAQPEASAAEASSEATSEQQPEEDPAKADEDPFKKVGSSLLKLFGMGK